MTDPYGWLVEGRTMGVVMVRLADDDFSKARRRGQLNNSGQTALDETLLMCMACRLSDSCHIKIFSSDPIRCLPIFVSYHSGDL